MLNRNECTAWRASSISLAVVLLLTGCDSNDDDGGGGLSSDDSRVTGTLVVPDNGADSSATLRMLDSEFWAYRMDENCPAVPNGYQPLSGAIITFLDSAGNSLEPTLTSDECGYFDTSAPEGTTQIRAEAETYRDIVADVSTFLPTAGNTGLASTIADTATYQIGSLQRLDASRIGFTVTDSESGQSVLGIPRSALTFAVEGAPAEVASLQAAASTQAVASISAVLDASGSMSTTAYTDLENGDRFSRSQLATRAAHVFLDQKAEQDEVLIVPFSSNVMPVDQAFIDTTFTLETLTGEPTTVTLSPSGYSADATRSRFVVDSYNSESDLYSRGTDPRHPDTPTDLSITSRYPYSGSTALYQGIVTGVERVITRSNERRFLLVMTDGNNNSSASSLEEAVAIAIANNIPVYTVGFGSGVNTDVLEEIATRTGASYFQVSDIDIGNAFQSIQTGIVFQYIAELAGVNLQEAFELSVLLDYNGVQVQRDVVLQ